MPDLNKLKNDDIRFHNSIDGLWDIALGLSVIATTILFLVDGVVFTGAFFILLIVTFNLVKSKVTYPRIGFVLHKGMKNNTDKLLIIIMMFGAVVLIIGAFLYSGITSGKIDEQTKQAIWLYMPVALGIVVTGVVLAAGLVLKLNRYMVYAAFLLVCFAAGLLIPIDRALVVLLIAAGATILTVGLVTFVRFLRTYPKLEDGDDDA